MNKIPHINNLAMLSAMAAAILERSCDHEGDEGKSHDLVTKDQSNLKMKKANPSVKG